MEDGKMAPPPLVNYATRNEYLEHYKRVYCKSKIITPDNIRVFFSEDRFNHAFYEGKHKGINFSFERAKYIDWIKYTLENEESQLLQGYCSDTGCYEPHRRTAVIKNDKYVVVVEMFYNKKDELCAKFKTAFYADRSFSKISQSPQWKLADCEAYLKKVI